jgi:hypothetical protein
MSSAEKAPPTKRTRSSALPEPLDSFTANDLDRLVVEDEFLKETIDGIEAGTHKMVVGIKVPTPQGGQTIVRFGKHVGELRLRNEQWRKLGVQMGLSYASRKTTVSVRVGLAIHARQEQIIQSNSLIPVENEKIVSITSNTDPSSNTNNRYSTSNTSPGLNQKRYNTLVRLINCLFSENHIPRFLKMNDKRDRSDHETGDGGKMQRFFEDVHKALYPRDDDDQSSNSSMSDDDIDDGDSNGSNASLKDPYGMIDFMDENDRLKDLSMQEGIDTKDCLTGVNVKMIEGWTHDLLAGRKKIQENKHKSGEGSDDDLDFTEITLKQKKLLQKIGIFPMYYFMLKAAKCEDFDQKFSPFLNSDLKGDSTDAISALSEDDKSRKSGSVFEKTLTKQWRFLLVLFARCRKQTKKTAKPKQKNGSLRKPHETSKLGSQR